MINIIIVSVTIILVTGLNFIACIKQKYESVDLGPNIRVIGPIVVLNFF